MLENTILIHGGGLLRAIVPLLPVTLRQIHRGDRREMRRACQTCLLQVLQANLVGVRDVLALLGPVRKSHPRQ